MAKKRKQPELDLETLFAALYYSANTSSHPDEIRSFLGGVQKKLKSTTVEEVHKTAKSYTLQDAVHEFNLKYNTELIYAKQYLWKIEALTDVKMMEPSECLRVLLNDYTSIYDRSSEAACRIAVDLLLCDCIAQMRGRTPQPTGNEFSPDRPSTPKLSAKIKVYCEVSFSHTIDTKSRSNSVVVGGRVDHGVGIVFSPKSKAFSSALGQLVVYLGSLRQSRISRGKSDSSVFGVATDGLNYMFVIITHEGVLMMSKQFDVLHGDLPTVLGCLRYILEKAMFMTPIVSPTQGGPQSEEMEDVDDADDVLAVHGRDNEDDSEGDSE
ncbi:hypothetical protein APHAL10511_008074 [Amanita phalloides]|nr:hypothetical protein APHAL10511_008074 [Amanita phalloides]